MAKAAKAGVIEVTDRVAIKFLNDVLSHYGNIESARGKFMNAARREREAMAVLFEGMAAKGISQKAAKTNIKIARALEKIKGWIAELEDEDRRHTRMLAKAQGDKRQLMLFGDLPKEAKPPRTPREDQPAARGNGELASSTEIAGSA